MSTPDVKKVNFKYQSFSQYVCENLFSVDTWENKSGPLLMSGQENINSSAYEL